MAFKFFDKNTGLRVSVNEELTEELHKPGDNTDQNGGWYLILGT